MAGLLRLGFVARILDFEALPSLDDRLRLPLSQRVRMVDDDVGLGTMDIVHGRQM
jgi:hypothetical protein